MRRSTIGLARGWGQVVGYYGRWNVRYGHVYGEGLGNVPPEPVIWSGWHGTNLIALAVLRALWPHRQSIALVPPTLAGEAMRGWLRATGNVDAVLIDERSSAKTALKHLAGALARGRDVVIAVDGPRGPAGIVRPGALWLARMTGAAIIPSGFAARPAVCMPRWDRQLVPLPLARIAQVYGPPIRLERQTPIAQPALDRLSAALTAASEQAWRLLSTPR